MTTECPLLWRACLAGDVQSMSKIIDRGVDPHYNDRNGENCLHMTARSGEVKAIELILQQGLDVNDANHNGQTPLHIAVTKDKLDTVKSILDNSGDTDITTKCSGMTALHMACKDNRVGLARLLIERGANCAIKDKIGKYPDFYTSDSKILSIFDTHFDVCRHGRGRHHGKEEATPQTTIIDDSVYRRQETSGGEDDHKKKKKKKKSKDRDKLEHGDIQHGDVEIYDKMEHYNSEGAKENWKKIKHEQKKLKINHGLGYSEEHIKRMQQNVFDRLMNGGKKKSN